MEILEVLSWYLDIMDEYYLYSIDGVIGESLEYTIELLGSIAKASKELSKLIIEILLEHRYSYEGRYEMEIGEELIKIFNSLNIDETYEIISSEDIIKYIDDYLEDILDKCEVLSEVVNRMDL